MRKQLYLWDKLRKAYIKELIDLHDTFCNKIFPIFDNAEETAKKYENQLWDEIMGSLGDENSDPSDYVDLVKESSIEKYDFINLMHYRNLAMWICCLCQVWEQQLHVFILGEACHEGIKYYKKDLGNGFSFDKDIFEQYGQPFEKLDCWKKINELRKLVNVIKHTEGFSEESLRKMRPDFFKSPFFDNTEFDTLDLYHNTLLETTLNISLNDFEEYYQALISFWKELPERMFEND